MLGGQSVNMLLDTGATSLAVTQSVAYSLVDAGQATWGPDVTVTLADGSTHDERTLFVPRVTIGTHTITDDAPACRLMGE
jgi:predicted aspartyl protease